jgi:hypothetical protein
VSKNKKMRAKVETDQSAVEDDWQRRATAAAIAAARKIVLGDAAVVNMNTPVGRLSDVEWGWIVAAVIFAWITICAEHATAKGLDTELVIRTAPLEAWDASAVATILPKLADMPGVDWSKPLAAWSRESMIDFLLTALDLMRTAIRARDLGGGSITRKSGADKLDDPIPSFS